jgi:hypothetical protein
MRWPACFSLTVAMIFGPVALAQFGQVDEKQFDSWVFQNVKDIHAARTKLEQQLALQTETVDRACRLTFPQRQKLQLAGRGDIKGFFEQVEIVRQRFLVVRDNQDKFNQIWQDIQPLQAAFQSGIFDDDSLFHKTLRNTLDAQQRSNFERVDGERRAFQYRAKVELTVALLENAQPLRDEQREKLVESIIKHTQPPRRYGQSDHYYILWSLSKLPEDTLRPIFDAAEWKVFSQQIAQGRNMEQWLRQAKVIGDDASEE